ncbi:MAG: hypothetical protein CSA23_01335 [Deltaproteobacteria bacterium]|nr:MAG: hypothetical protein CSA23_01335 [Deltaproteobacteria bacterium]
MCRISAASVQLDLEKIELYVFVDGKMLFEGPHPALPATVTVDTTSIPNGRHFFTFNLRTFEDHLGTCSLWADVGN